MVRSLLSFRVADLFCGAGGFSEAVVQALGEARVNLTALNHWDRAIETHAANHPNARSERADLYDEDPLKWFKRGELDLLIASPTCIYYSRARGGRPVSFDQRKGRMTPTQVLRWCKALLPKRVLIENVPEFEDWGPVSRETGKPRKEKAGVYFRQFVRRLRELGYFVTYKVVNAADFGDWTSRHRLFVMASLESEPKWPIPTHSEDGVPDLFGGGAERHRPARDIINWKLRGASIFTREKPLVENTLLRVHTGLIKCRWPVAFVLKLRLYMIGLGIDLPEIEFTGDRARPFVFQMNQARKRVRGIRSVDQPLGTITATGTDLGLIEPFLLSQHFDAGPRSVERPLPPPVSVDRTALLEPFVLSQGAGGAPREVSGPLPTNPARGAHALIAPYYGNGSCKTVDEPLDTVTTRDRFGFFVAAFGERPGQTPRVHTLDDPAPTLCAKGRIPFVQGITLAHLNDVDILYRMLEPSELAAAMGFPADYRFVGNKTERTRMVGNAVAVNTARALVAALMEDA